MVDYNLAYSKSHVPSQDWNYELSIILVPVDTWLHAELTDQTVGLASWPELWVVHTQDCSLQFHFLFVHMISLSCELVLNKCMASLAALPIDIASFPLQLTRYQSWQVVAIYVSFI